MDVETRIGMEDMKAVATKWFEENDFMIVEDEVDKVI